MHTSRGQLCKNSLEAGAALSLREGGEECVYSEFFSRNYVWGTSPGIYQHLSIK